MLLYMVVLSVTVFPTGLDSKGGRSRMVLIHFFSFSSALALRRRSLVGDKAEHRWALCLEGLGRR